MVNFLSSFLPNLQRLLIPIYDLQKKAKKFKWMDEAERAFNEIKQLLVSPPVLKAPTPDGLFRLESDTSREGVGGTLLQKQGNEWIVIGYHSKDFKISKEFWCYRVRTKWTIGKHSWVYATIMQQIF